MASRLFIDENLRGLARWLRFLGFDTKLAAGGQADADILRSCAREGRLLFTRDRALAGTGSGIRFLEARRPREQLAEALRGLERPPREAWFSRCVLCNERLREISPAERGPAVPGEFSRYWRCEPCGRTYWRGSHYERTLRFLEELLPPGPA